MGNISSARWLLSALALTSLLIVGLLAASAVYAIRSWEVLFVLALLALPSWPYFLILRRLAKPAPKRALALAIRTGLLMALVALAMSAACAIRFDGDLPQVAPPLLFATLQLTMVVVAHRAFDALEADESDRRSRRRALGWGMALGIGCAVILLVESATIDTRQANSESHAIGALREWRGALGDYQRSCGGWPGRPWPPPSVRLSAAGASCATLGAITDPSQRNALEALLSARGPWRQFGYSWTYEASVPVVAGEKRGPPYAHFRIHADPPPGQRWRSFWMSDEGVVRWSKEGPAGPDSPALR